MNLNDIANLDILNPEHVTGLFVAARDYRESNFDAMYDKARAYDENYKTGIRRDDQLDFFEYVVQQAMVAEYLDRLQAELGSLRVTPIIHCEDPGDGLQAEVIQAVLRWLWRVGKCQQVQRNLIRSTLNFGRATPCLWWNPKKLEGLGAPEVRVKDIKDIFIDPRSRAQDLNDDCQWLFEVQWYTQYELQRMFPLHNEYLGGNWTNFDTTARTLTEGQTIQPGSLSNPISKEQGGLFPIVRCEFLLDMDRRISVSAILDPGNRKWITDSPPIDNGLGCYSYPAYAFPNRNKCAYTDPPTRHLWTKVDLANLGYTFAVQSMADDRDPNYAVAERDDAAIASLKDPERNKRGWNLVYKSERPPEKIQRVPALEAFRIAAGLRADSDANARVSEISKGNAPPNISSGTAIESLRTEADIPNDLPRAIIEEGAGRMFTVLYRLARVHLTGFREINDSQMGQARSIPLNVPDTHPRYKQVVYAPTPQSPVDGEPNPPTQTAPSYLTARWQTPDGQQRMGSLNQVSEAMRQDPTALQNFQLILNDIRAGLFEISAELAPQLSAAQEAQMASTLFAAKVAGPKYFLRKSGVENPDAVWQERVEYDQILQLGQAAQNDPLVQAVMQNPQVRALVEQILMPPASAGANPHNQPTTEVAGSQSMAQPTAQPQGANS